MEEKEGVIKYQLEHRLTAININRNVAEIDAWRCILYRLGLIGQHPDKYQGYGFGNISCRLGDNDARFIITGTQTGHLQHLGADDFSIVEHASPEENQLFSYGPCRPSSEALTHAMLYRQKPDIQAVIHVHSFELWQATQRLALPHTAADVAYGTPAMAQAVQKLFVYGQLGCQGVFSMLGHEDGVVAFGKNMTTAAQLLISTLSKAIEIASADN